MKAEPSRLIPKKRTEILKLLMGTINIVNYSD